MYLPWSFPEITSPYPAHQDPTPFRTFTHQLQHSRALVYPRQPAKSQGAPLSSLQLLVKDARECILEPLDLGFGVGAGSGALSEPLVEETEDSLSGVMTSGVTENVIIGTRRSGLRVTIPSRSQLRTRLANEASATTNAVNTPTTRSSGEPMSTAPWHITPASSDPSPTTPSFPPTPASETTNAIPETQPKIKITRLKNLANVVSTSVSAPARTRVRQATSAAMDIDAEPRALIQPPLTIKLGKRGRAPSASPAPALASQAPGAELTVSNKGKGRDKKKPETYKQAWSVSEQHLLEKLLEDIPEGSKNRLDSPFSKLKVTLTNNSHRWQKISIAMSGRRTPRQVASRVQKYFEKLKRYGLGVGIDNRSAE
ncbi:hypothetical protein HWV62_44283 [Athelia sp. TMB]|nr:hypothetical protein HWV62_44283 [Athelia sp. TMB]